MLQALRRELRELDTGRRALRSFGLTVGAVLVAIAAFMAWKRGGVSGLWIYGLGGAGAVLVMLGAAFPAVLRPVYIPWMGLAFALSLVMTPVLLTLVFVFIATPAGLVLRLTGRDPMRRRPGPGADSYWQKKPPPEAAAERLTKYY